MVAERAVILLASRFDIDVVEGGNVGGDDVVHGSLLRGCGRRHDATDQRGRQSRDRIQGPEVAAVCVHLRNYRNQPICRQREVVGTCSQVGRLVSVGAIAPQFIEADADAKLPLLPDLGAYLARIEAKIGPDDAPAQRTVAVVGVSAAHVEIEDAVKASIEKPVVLTELE